VGVGLEGAGMGEKRRAVRVPKSSDSNKSVSMKAIQIVTQILPRFHENKIDVSRSGFKK
jgi:hypothetical protein